MCAGAWYQLLAFNSRCVCMYVCMYARVMLRNVALSYATRAEESALAMECTYKLATRAVYIEQQRHKRCKSINYTVRTCTACLVYIIAPRRNSRAMLATYIMYVCTYVCTYKNYVQQYFFACMVSSQLAPNLFLLQYRHYMRMGIPSFSPVCTEQDRWKASGCPSSGLLHRRSADFVEQSGKECAFVLLKLKGEVCCK